MLSQREVSRVIVLLATSASRRNHPRSHFFIILANSFSAPSTLASSCPTLPSFLLLKVWPQQSDPNIESRSGEKSVYWVTIKGMMCVSAKMHSALPKLSFQNTLNIGKIFLKKYTLLEIPARPAMMVTSEVHFSFTL